MVDVRVVCDGLEGADGDVWVAVEGVDDRDGGGAPARIGVDDYTESDRQLCVELNSISLRGGEVGRTGQSGPLNGIGWRWIGRQRRHRLQS